MGKISIRLLVLLAIIPFVFSCSDESFSDQVSVNDEANNNRVINKRGSLDGITYSLDNISLNPDLLVINKENVDLISTEQELKDGIIKLFSVSDEISKQLLLDKILYVNVDGYTVLRKIDAVIYSKDGSFELRTTQAQLGEIFDGGTIDFSVDLSEIAKIENEKASNMRLGSYGRDYSYEIVNINGKYDQWGFEYNPATNIKMSLNVGLSFAKRQLLPSQFTTVFELETNINPSLKFAASFNKAYSDDFVKFVPQSIMEQIRGNEFEIDIPINTLGIESLPAKIKIQDVTIPTTVEANLSQESNITYGVNGNLKIGYVLDIDGFTSKVTPVYENSLQATIPSTLAIHGELLHSTEIIITPDVTILDNAYNVSGDIKLAISSESNGHINIPNKDIVFGTKGVFTAGMNLNLDLAVMKVPIQILNIEKVLWSEGTIDRTIVYSDLKSQATSNYTTNILSSTRLYQTNFSLNYRYPILGKILANELFISYEVYQKNGTTKLETVNNLSITPENLTANSFSFSLNIPYKKSGGIFSSTYETESYLKNIVIRDSKGYVYEGIFNTSKNTVENSFLIKR